MRVYWHSPVVALNIGKGFEKDLHKSILDTSLLKNRISIISLNRLLFSNGNRIGHNPYSHKCLHCLQSDLCRVPEDLGNDPRACVGEVKQVTQMLKEKLMLKENLKENERHLPKDIDWGKAQSN